MLLISSGYGPLLCPCEHGNEPIGSIVGGKSLMVSATATFSKGLLFDETGYLDG
jgi:hypothetical protein